MVHVFGSRGTNILFKKVSQLFPKNAYKSFRELSSFSRGSVQKHGRIHSVLTDRHNQRNYGECGKPPTCVRDDLLCHVTDPVVDCHDKVTIVGAGMVGVACANALLFQKISSHVAILDVFPKKLKGEGFDFNHSLTFLDDPVVEYDTDFCVTSNSKVVIVTIGARQTGNESRHDLVQKNADIIKNIMTPLVEYSPRAVFIMVTNPVDIMSWLAWKVTGVPLNRMIGSGCHLDSARFRFHLSQRLGFAASSINAFIIGEHGDSQVPLWSGVNVSGVLLREILPNIGLPTDEEKWTECAADTVHDGATVRCLKGYSNTAIGLSAADICKSILRNSQQVKSVSTLVQGHHGVCDETFLSLPCTIGENGVTNVLRLRMTELERKQFQYSSSQVMAIQKCLKF